MQYLENLITETKNKKAKENLLLLQKFCGGVDQDKQTFINIMMSMCGVNKDYNYCHFYSISIGQHINEKMFETFLGTMITYPIVIVSYFENEPIIYIKDKYNTVSCFNLTDIQVKEVGIKESEDGLVRYRFIIHSQYNNLDYNLNLVLQEVK